MKTFLPADRTEWRLSIGSAVDSVGYGLFIAGGLIYFTSALGLTPAQVGAGLSISALLGFAVAVPAGILADAWGPRRIAILMALAQAATMASFLFVRSYGMFLVVASLFACAERGGITVRRALIGALIIDRSRVRVQAYLRSVFNVGISVGTLAAAAVLQARRPELYEVLIVANALSFIGLAVANLTLPQTPAGRPRKSGPRRAAIQNGKYVQLGLLSGLLGLHVSILDIGLPLWITLHTAAPPFLIALVFLVNTAIAIALQVRLSRSSGSVPGAARSLGRSSACGAVACLVLAPTGWLPWFPAAVTILAAVMVLSIGDLLQAAGSWGLSFGLAGGEQQGEHLGTFSLGEALRDTIGPILITSLVVGSGAAGWAALSVLFLLLGALVAPLAARASVACEIDPAPAPLRTPAH